VKKTVEHNNRFYGKELKTENEQLKEWLVIANKEMEKLNNGLKVIKWYIEKNKTSFSDLYIPASDVVSILVIIDRLLGSDKEWKYGNTK